MILVAGSYRSGTNARGVIPSVARDLVFSSQ
jgi:hypothetical protein